MQVIAKQYIGFLLVEPIRSSDASSGQISAFVAIVVVTVVHLDASHSTPTGHTRISVVPHAACLMLLLIPAPARGDKLCFFWR